MSVRLMDACLNASDSLNDYEDISAIMTTLFGEAEQSVVTQCINDPKIKTYMNKLVSFANKCTAGLSTNTRAQYQAQINKYQQLLQERQTQDQNFEQSWDERTQTAQTSATMASTDTQQTVQIASAVISAFSYISGLLSSLL